MKNILLFTVLFGVSTMVHGEDMMDMRTAFRTALLSPPGTTFHSSVNLGGQGFSSMSEQTKSSAPFLFDVTKVMDYPKKGCGKLKMVIHQPGGFGQKDFQMTQYLSICADGSPYEHPDMTVPKESDMKPQNYSIAPRS